jgi:hypothetical protein
MPQDEMYMSGFNKTPLS